MVDVYHAYSSGTREELLRKNIHPCIEAERAAALVGVTARVVVAAATPEGGIDLAWRGESLEWEARGGASLRPGGGSAAVADLPDGSKLIAGDGSFQISRSPDADGQSGSER